MLRRLLVLLTLLISLAGAEEYHYYVGIVREPTRSYASSDTTEPESYIADGTICAFIQGMMFWSHPTSENGLINIHVFNNNYYGGSDYLNTWIPESAIQLYEFPCDEKPYANAPACSPVGIKSFTKQKWADNIVALLEDKFKAMGVPRASKAVLTKAEFDSAVIVADARPPLPEMEPAPFLAHNGETSLFAFATGVGTRMAKREANRQVNRAERIAGEKVDELKSDVNAIKDEATQTGQQLKNGAASLSNALTNAALVEMLKQGLSKDIVLLKIKTSPAKFDLSNAGLKSLQDNNVPLEIIEAMMAKK